MAVTSYSSRTTLANVMKDFYAPRIQKQYYNSTPAMSRLKRVGPDEIQFAGKQIVIPVHKGWSEAVGARAEGDDLPEAYYPQTDQMIVDVAYNYGRIKITRPTMKASRDPGAWQRALKFVMDDLKENMGWDGARQRVHGTGTGAITQANGGGTASASLVVDDASLLKEGMLIDVFTLESGGTQQVDGIRISSIDGNTVTLASAQTWSDNAYVFRKDTRGLEITGLAAVIDDGTRKASFQNKTRSTNPWLKANRLANSGTNRALSLSLVDQACVKAEQSGGGGYPTAIYSNHAIALKYAALLTTNRRYVNEKEFDGGWKGIMHTHLGGTSPWFADRMVRPNVVWFPHEPDIAEAQLSALQFVDEDGDVLKWVSGKDEFEAYMAEYCNVVAYRCNRHTELADITES